MAKIKAVPRNVEGTKPQKVLKCNSGASRKISKKGKIPKKLPKEEKMKKNNDENNAYINKFLEIQSQTRLCFVNIKRIGSNSEKTNDTLQVQCKTVLNNFSAIKKNVENETDDKDNRKNLLQNENFELSTKQQPREVDQERNSFVKSPQKNYAQNNNVQCLVETRGKIAGLDEKVVKTTPKATRKCTVKLPKNKFKAQKQHFKDNVKSSIDTRGNMRRLKEKNVKTTPEVTRKCTVKLQKMVQKCTPQQELRTIGTTTHGKTSLTLSEIENPTLSQHKRDAFGKLSLTKPKTINKTISTEEKRPVSDVSLSNNTENKQTAANNTLAMNKKTLNFKSKQSSSNLNATIDFEPSRNSTVVECNTKQTQSNTSQEKDAVKHASTEFNSKKPISQNTDVKLTLGKNTRKANKKNMHLKKITSMPEKNSSVDFEHVKNSTLEGCNTSEIDNSNLPPKASIQKPHSVEDLPNSISLIINKCSPISKTHKFFHRKDFISAGENGVNFAKESVSKTRVKRTKRSSQMRRDVYDFLSQSQTSESDDHCKKHVKSLDPTEDVIKRLIAQGKVVVATNQKGKGKPKIKRNVNKKTLKVIKQARKKKVASQKSNKQENEQIVDQDDPNLFDHFLDDVADDHVNTDFNTHKQVRSVYSARKTSHNLNTDQEGTFSNLAKSVLINQAGLNDSQRLKAQHLLAIAKKIISTPKNNRIPLPQTALNVNYSPIVKSNKMATLMPTPWRVDENANLPRVFNFSRSSGNLPSFSSDVIPPTPKKEKNKNKTLHRANENENQSQLQDSFNLQTIENVCEDSRLVPVQSPNFVTPSSFSSNDSNAENKTPPMTRVNKTKDINTNIFDLKQFPNPRKTLSSRSPLKPINILEVVHLPPIPNVKSIALKENEVPENGTFITPSKPSKKQKATTNFPDEDLFGFEDFLSQTDISSQENEEYGSSNEQLNNSLNDKLHGLRKLRPNSCELEINLEHANKNIPNLFNDPGLVSKPQKCIREMLQQPSTSKKCYEFNLRNAVEEANISDLFKDPDTTFREEDPHRTYIQPYKRKRRLREDKLIFEFDSDASEDEHNGSPKKRKRGHNQSNETDTSSEQIHKKTRKIKEKPELKQFVEEFNEMCEEVDKYQLVVERSA